MKSLKTLMLSGMLLMVVFIVQCGNNPEGKKAPPAAEAITPVPLPVTVPGFNFPEDSNTIYSWLQPYDSTSIYTHAWGVWAGLTASSGQAFHGDSLLVFETWHGINEIQCMVADGLKEIPVKTARTSLAIPHQLNHSISVPRSIDSVPDFWVSVAYDPAATQFVVSNALLKESVLKSYLKKDAIGYIPPFPSAAITIKPTYFVGSQKDSLIRIAAWPGPPSTPAYFGNDVWNSFVYIDVHNKQVHDKKLIPVTTTTPTTAQIAAATCNLSDFIHYRIDKEMAFQVNQQQDSGSYVAEPGDIALLVAMHVATKEISNWTWQSFYWAPNPDDPLSPSSPLAARLRPRQLKGAASHYAVTTAYTEVLPNQPIKGGTNEGVKPMIGYNPYLEASFDSATFAYFKNRLNPQMMYGVQTNCMSCHTLATPQSVNDSTANPVYTTAQYISLADKFFINKVQLDFAWSIQGSMISDTFKCKPPKTN